MQGAVRIFLWGSGALALAPLAIAQNVSLRRQNHPSLRNERRAELGTPFVRRHR